MEDFVNLRGVANDCFSDLSPEEASKKGRISRFSPNSLIVTTGFMYLDCLSRWEIGEWTDCTKSCNDGERGVRSREVFCVEDSQGVELEVEDSKCKEPRPISQEACGKQPCPAEWYTEHAVQVSYLY